jgi:hypothetical protein
VTEVDLGVKALASLLPLSFLAGIGVLWIFRRASDQPAIRRAKNLAAAHLLEFRLFMDEPRLILRAQRDLILANLRFMRLMLRPFLVMALPMALLLVQMDAFYGHSPLLIGHPAIVTLQWKAEPGAAALEPPAGIAVESVAVRVVSGRQTSWRIRPLRSSSGDLRISCPDGVLTKSISSGPGPAFLSERRAGSLAGFLLHPTEWPFSSSEIEWIEVRYPGARVLHFHWLIWFLVVSAITAFALRRRFHTTF